MKEDPPAPHHSEKDPVLPTPRTLGAVPWTGPCFWRYMAASAWRSSCSADRRVEPSWTATPTLVPTATSVLSSRKASAKQATTRSAAR